MMRRAAGLLLLLLLLFLPGGAPRAADGKESFGGIGLAVVPTATGELAVLKVVEKSPAAASGLRPGDLVVEVDGYPLRGSDFPEVVSRRLWGEAGTTVRLKYLRPGEAGERTAALRRVPMDPAVGETPGVKMMRPESGKKEGEE